MSDLVLHEPLATEVRQVAEAEGTTAEEVVKAAMRRFRAAARRKKIKAEAEWWASAPAEFRAQYAGEYVAVHRQEVVDHDPDETVLFDRMRVRFPDDAVLITPAEGRREIRVRRPRLERAI